MYRNSLSAMTFLMLLLPVTVPAASWEQVAPGEVEAFTRGDLSEVKRILERNTWYREPRAVMQVLPTAVGSGNVELVKHLASLGWFDVCRAAEEGCYPIHWAAAAGKVDMIRYLMSEGFNIHGITAPVSGLGADTALHIAARMGQFEAVRFLCEQGVESAVKNSGRYTALDEATISSKAKNISQPRTPSEEVLRASLTRIIDYLGSGQCQPKRGAETSLSR